MKSLSLKDSSGLPANIEKLAKLALFTREKLTAVKAAVRAMDKLSIALAVRDQKNKEAQDVASTLLDIEVKLGELFQKMEKRSGGDHKSQYRNIKSFTSETFDKSETVRKLGFTNPKNTAHRLQLLAKHPDVVAEVKAKAIAADDIPTRAAILRAIARKLKTTQRESTPKFVPEPGKYGMRDILDDHPEVKTEIDEVGKVVIQQTNVDLSSRLIRAAWSNESIRQLIDLLEILLLKERKYYASPDDD